MIKKASRLLILYLIIYNHFEKGLDKDDGVLQKEDKKGVEREDLLFECYGVLQPSKNDQRKLQRDIQDINQILANMSKELFYDTIRPLRIRYTRKDGYWLDFEEIATDDDYDTE